MNIAGLNKARILVALFNASRAQGTGALIYQNAPPITQEEAQAALDSGQTYFDYVRGRVMKVDLSGDELDLRLYDRDNGEGAGERAVLSAFNGKVGGPQLSESERTYFGDKLLGALDEAKP